MKKKTPTKKLAPKKKSIPSEDQCDEFLQIFQQFADSLTSDAETKRNNLATALMFVGEGLFRISEQMHTDRKLKMTVLDKE